MKKPTKLPNPFTAALYAKATKRPLSPLVDEQAILAVLSQPCDVLSAEYTRTASVMTILDAFDRRLERDEAIIIFQSAVELNERIREAEMVARVLWDVGHGKYKFDPPEASASYETVLKARLEMAETARIRLLTQMTKVAQCPWADDLIH